MASNPTTKSQVQAYRFMLRRMESALTRKDAVMLHDPMGTHKRANIAGLLIAALGVIVFLVWGLFGGKGTVPEPGSIVIGKESGSVYVVTADARAQKRLIPMFNMASARLLVMAQGGGQGGAVKPTTVKEAALGELPRGPRTGMLNAPVYLPDGKNPAPAEWAVCDVGQVNSELSDDKIEGSARISTTVIGGDPSHGQPLPTDRSLYVEDQSSGQRYLVYVPQSVPGHRATKTVKAPVDPNQTAVMDMYGLSGVTPRVISTNMLNAIPDAPALVVPRPAGDRQPVSYMQSGAFRVGDVVRRTVPGQPEQYFVLLNSGKQPVSRGAAAVLHASHSASRDIPNATGEITEARDAARAELLPIATFPVDVPRPVTFQEFNTSCLSWKEVGGEHRITATIDKKSPAAKPAVELARSDGPGPNVDFFFMPAGKSAVIRGTSSPAGTSSGPMYLVSDQGVIYGVKDEATAQGLGIINSGADVKAGPAWITRVLPSGAFLDPAQASWVYDSVPVPNGGVNRPPPPQGS